jgi:hypothetical protein
MLRVKYHSVNVSEPYGEKTKSKGRTATIADPRGQYRVDREGLTISASETLMPDNWSSDYGNFEREATITLDRDEMVLLLAALVAAGEPTLDLELNLKLARHFLDAASAQSELAEGQERWSVTEEKVTERGRTEVNAEPGNGESLAFDLAEMPPGSLLAYSLDRRHQRVTTSVPLSVRAFPLEYPFRHP